MGGGDHHIGFSGGMTHGGHHGVSHCRDVIDKDSKKSKRFCVPVGYHGGYGWPYWHGYPGVGTGLWGWGWPWIKAKVPKGDKDAKKEAEAKPATSSTEEKLANKGKNKKATKESARSDIPTAEEQPKDKKTKKQTIHVGYGYASGDNYRLGYGFGGMGGVAGFSGGQGAPGSGPPGGPEAAAFKKADIPAAVAAAPAPVKEEVKKTNIPQPEQPKDVTATKRDFGHADQSLPGGFGSAGAMGHPVTHPGFTTMGYPGHALSSTDVKNKIPVVKSRRSTGEGLFEPIV